MTELTDPRFSHTTREWLSGTPVSVIVDSYIQSLIDRGYAVATVASYLACVAHFGNWLASRRLALEDIEETVIGVFLDRHLPTCRCAPRCRRARSEARAALAQLLALLRSEGRIADKRATLPPAIEAELAAFERYLREARGLRRVTRQTQMKYVRAFLLQRFAEGEVRVASLTPSDLVGFTKEHRARWQPASLRNVYASLRSYLRFKASQGIETAALMGALPKVAQWRLARLPRGLSCDELERFLGAFQRSTAAGRRDYAIARCYVDLALRSVEIARLRLDDLDWREGTVRIRGKGRRVDLLPLPSTTGQAIAEYLQWGRRHSPSRTLFLRHHPPLDQPPTPGTFRTAMRNAAKRCGLANRLTGPHVLRHTVAERLVRNGASLKAIADFLRHRCLDTTTIYAKVDFDALATVAAPWPGERS